MAGMATGTYRQLVKRQPVLAAIEALAVRVLFVKRAVRVSREE